MERRISRIASRAHGVVTRKQLLAAGMTKDEIDWRIRIGLLHCLFRGVYRFGHQGPGVEARYMAAVLACGEGALLSGRAAAHLFGLIRGSTPRAEVIAPTERRVRGVTTRRSRRMGDIARTRWKGIPVTTVPRQVATSAAWGRPRHAQRA